MLFSQARGTGVGIGSDYAGWPYRVGQAEDGPIWTARESTGYPASVAGPGFTHTGDALTHLGESNRPGERLAGAPTRFSVELSTVA